MAHCAIVTIRLVAPLRVILLAPVLVALVATQSSPPAAHAEGTSQVQGIDSVLYEGCHRHPFEYSLDPVKAEADWVLRVSVKDPDPEHHDGHRATMSVLSKEEGLPSSGVATGDNALFICDFETPGSWQLVARLEFSDDAHPDELLPRSTFTMREPRSRTRLAVNDTTARYGQVLRFRIRSRVEGPSGYVPNRSRYVVLQKRTASGWERIRRRRTDENGVVRTRVTWRHSKAMQVRAITPRTEIYTASLSPRIWIR